MWICRQCTWEQKESESRDGKDKPEEEEDMDMSVEDGVFGNQFII